MGVSPTGNGRASPAFSDWEELEENQSSGKAEDGDSLDNDDFGVKAYGADENPVPENDTTPPTPFGSLEDTQPPPNPARASEASPPLLRSQTPGSVEFGDGHKELAAALQKKLEKTLDDSLYPKPITDRLGIDLSTLPSIEGKSLEDIQIKELTAPITKYFTDQKNFGLLFSVTINNGNKEAGFFALFKKGDQWHGYLPVDENKQVHSSACACHQMTTKIRELEEVIAKAKAAAPSGSSSKNVKARQKCKDLVEGSTAKVEKLKKKHGQHECSIEIQSAHVIKTQPIDLLNPEDPIMKHLVELAKGFAVTIFERAIQLQHSS